MTDTTHHAAHRAVTLPNGRRVPLGAYVAGWRLLKETPPETMFRGWDHFPTEASAILAEYRRGMQDRINRRGGLVVRKSRVHPSWWGKVATPRMVLEPFEVRAMSPAARRHLHDRIRCEP